MPWFLDACQGAFRRQARVRSPPSSTAREHPARCQAALLPPSISKASALDAYSNDAHRPRRIPRLARGPKGSRLRGETTSRPHSLPLEQIVTLLPGGRVGAILYLRRASTRVERGAPSWEAAPGTRRGRSRLNFAQNLARQEQWAVTRGTLRKGCSAPDIYRELREGSTSACTGRRTRILVKCNPSYRL